MYPHLKQDRNIQITLKILSGYSCQRAANIYSVSKSRINNIFYKTIIDSVPKESQFKEKMSVKQLRKHNDELVPYVVAYQGK